MKRLSILVLWIALLTGCDKAGYPISIPESQINAAMAKSFPVTQTFLKLIDLTYSDPKITLRPGSDRVQLDLNAKLNIKLLPGARDLKGTCTVESGVRYQAGTRQFFLADPVIKKLAIDGLPPDYVDRVTMIALELTRSRLEAFPIYTVESSHPAVTAAAVLVKDVRVSNGAIQVILGL
ncbi:MAG: DUF1439 domain-containing protein [Verrucomicrobiales bacterium]